MAETPHMLTRLKKKMTHKKKHMIFRGSKENYVRNGAWVVEESIALFHGRANPLRHLSVDDLNNMNVEPLPYCKEGYYNLYQGSWEGRVVLVKKPCRDAYPRAKLFMREIVVATQMATHNNAHKILGCCLETDIPVLVYEWMPPETLQDRVKLNDENQSKAVLEWKDRLRIAWEISHVVAYLHNAFPRSIIHTNLKPSNVFLDQHNAAKLRDFSLSESIPEGEEFVELAQIEGTNGYMAPEYIMHGKVSKSTDVYSFGVLFLVLLAGMAPQYFYLHEEGKPSINWVVNYIKRSFVKKIVDPAITRNGVTTIEDLQLRASAQLALRCVSNEEDYRPTMVEVATQLKNMITSPESIPTATNFQENGLNWIFRRSEEYILHNKAGLLKESFSLFRDSAHPIRHYFSVHELNNMSVKLYQVSQYCYRGTWEGKAVLVKLSSYSDEIHRNFIREIVVATQMANHCNIQKLLGCCVETKLPVLVYEWVAEETLTDRILLKDENQTKPVLEWKERLKIAWEISHVVSHLHYAFPRPIIHGYLETDSILLDLDSTFKLSNFSRSMSIPEGQNFVEVFVEDSAADFMELEYNGCARLAECTDVYSFGILFLVLLTGKSARFKNTKDGRWTHLINWVTEKFKKVSISEIVDPAIIKNGVATSELTASIKLALWCTAKIDKRPNMVDVASELEKIIRSSDLPNEGFSLLRGYLTS